MSRKIWINGTLRSSSEGTIPLSANALHYGTGAFEGILCIRNGRAHTIFRAKDHIDRLFRSAGLLGLEIPFTEETLARALQEFVTGNKYGSCYLRPVVFSDGDFLSFGTAKKKAHAAILGKRFPAAFYWWRMKRPIRITIADQPRSTLTGPWAAAKVCGKYWGNAVAKQASAKTADDAVLLDGNGMIAEATAANIFLVKDGILKTPPCTCTLDGITRKTVMRLAQDLGVPVEQTPVSPDALFNADEVFLTGTAHGIVSVDAVDGHCISRRDTPEITAALRDKYIAIISGRDVPYPEWITCF